MARDLLFGKTTHSWARGTASPATPAPAKATPMKVKKTRGGFLSKILSRKPRTPTASASSGSVEIIGRDEILGAFVGDDERALAAEGGACEREALARRQVVLP